MRKPKEVPESVNRFSRLDASMLIGKEALWFTVLINGLGALGVLTLILIPVISRNMVALRFAASPLGVFSAGLACSGIAYGFAYGCWRLSESKALGKKSVRYLNYNAFEAIAIAAAALSVVLFLLGVDGVRQLIFGLGAASLNR